MKKFKIYISVKADFLNAHPVNNTHIVTLSITETLFLNFLR